MAHVVICPPTVPALELTQGDGCRTGNPKGKCWQQDVGRGNSCLKLSGTSNGLPQINEKLGDTITDHHGDEPKLYYNLIKTSFDMRLEQAVQEVMHLVCLGFCIPDSSITHLVQWCIKENNLEAAHEIYFIASISGLQLDTFVANHLMHMFSFFGCLEEVTHVFSNLPKANVFSWSTVILAHAKASNYEVAIQFYNEMIELGIKPDAHTFVAVLKACSGTGNLELGYSIHFKVVKSGLEFEAYVASTLIDMYAKCGDIQKARSMFHRLPHKNVVIWGVLIAGYIHCGHGDEALVLFNEMQQQGIEPNLITVTSVLKAISHIESGLEIHSCIVECGLESDAYVSSALVDMYARCTGPVDASLVFQRLHKRDVATWNAMITSYCQHAHDHLVLMLFQQMQQERIQPNQATFTCLFKACVYLGTLEQGMQIHAYIIENDFELDVFTGSGLIDMYMKFGKIPDALSVFCSLPKQNVVTWSALISGLCQHGQGQLAFQYFSLMKQEGIEPNDFTFVSLLQACSNLLDLQQGTQVHLKLIEHGLDLDTFVGNALIAMYAKCGDIQNAYKVFNKLPNKDVITWSSLLSGFVQNQEGQTALEHFFIMCNQGIIPNTVTLITALKACGSIAALDHGRELHSHIILSGFMSDPHVGSAVIDMYAKCGCVDEASIVFQQIPKHDAVVWGTMINGYAQHSDYKTAFHYFDAMQREGVKPDSVVLLNVLSACTNSYLVQEGCQYFKSTIYNYSNTPRLEHLNCMVDLLGSANHLNEAEDLLETIPFGSNIVGWMCLLTSCKRHVNVDLARKAFHHILALDNKNVASYVLMSDIYTSSGMQEDAKKIDELRLMVNGWKKPGKAFIEVDRVIHSFLVNDKRHQKSKEIYQKLKDLETKMFESGYKSEPRQSLCQTEDDGCGHCEKLAIAFGLLYTSHGKTIRVSKNLRMCATCHSDTGFISKSEKREIIILDASRVHHFQHGLCPCNMYGGENG